MKTFYEIGLSEPIIKAVAKMGFEEITPIQRETIPIALEGRDLIGQAQTGTGKTAAFGIPMVEKISPHAEGVKGLVVTPTRELAIQVAEEINKIGEFKGIKALPIYGGQNIERQIRVLKNRPQIIVGTPGRLLDHLKRKTIRLNQMEILILDEADEMLNMGFIEDIETIIAAVPQERQTLLFSATVSENIRELTGKFMNNPKMVSVKSKEVTAAKIEQNYLEVQESQKFDVLCRLLDIHSPVLSIVFARTKRRVDEIEEALNQRGYSAQKIHGDLSQSQRGSVLRQFKQGLTEVLVATDVAARGLDISGVTHVYNFDIPQEPESYIHRIGRTGRAGKSGIAITLVTPREQGQLRAIEQATKKKIARIPIPTITEVMEGQQKAAVQKLLNTLNKDNTALYHELAFSLLKEHDSVKLLASALKLLTKEPETVKTAYPQIWQKNGLENESANLRSKSKQAKIGYIKNSTNRNKDIKKSHKIS